MVLLTVLAVGLLTLSTIALRKTSQDSSQSVARANARLALMMAVGELQKNAGPDTRVTARADILDEDNPPVLGVWKSWEGTDHEDSGRPVSPGNYKSSKEERFLGWLTSEDALTVPDTSKGASKVTLVGDGTVGRGADREKLQVHLTPTFVDGRNVNGSKLHDSFAWWVSGENQKARLSKPYEPESDSAAGWAMNAKSHAVADPGEFGLESVLDEPSQVEKAVSLKQSDLLSVAQNHPGSQEYFHDLSTSSVGLLTNVATGGWKKDFSLLTERWDDVGKSNLPLFQVKPGEDALYGIPTSSNAYAAKSMLYPWASYRGGSSNSVFQRHGAVASWEHLRDYSQLYKKMSASSSGKASIDPVSTDIVGDSFNFLHRVRILPVVARIQWVFSHWTGPPVPAPTGTSAGFLEPRLLMTPVITLWNPYNVEMNFTNVPIVFSIERPLPMVFRYNVGVQNANYNSLTDTSVNYPASMIDKESPNKPVGLITYTIENNFLLMPGETRVFSPESTVPVKLRRAPSNILPIPLKPGYRSGGGHYLSVKSDQGKSMAVAPETLMKVDAKFDNEFDDVSVGVGVYLNIKFPGNQRHLAYRMNITGDVAREVYPELTKLVQSSLSQAQASPTPFLTTIFGARMASKTLTAAKGFVQSSPLVNYTAMGGKDMVESTIARHYGGTGHPVNSPFDFSFEPLYANDSLLPNASDATNRGYIVTGFTKSDGLSRCTIAELPTRPLQSLAELQNWDMRYENPIPPFAFNLIGNSDASPLLPDNAVVNSADAGLATNLQHDDSYCANHLLFDDWFVSSIAPNPTNFGGNGKSLKDTFVDWVTGESPLPNRSYDPVETVAIAQGDTLYSEEVTPKDSWRTIASRIEVEGMFNVNSTSLTAWKALLGHARNQKVPFYEESGGSWSLGLSGETDHAFSRFSVAGDVEAGTLGSSGTFTEASELSGYRVLDEAMLEALAEEIVNQVRLRGPFLSLSEFINRQLSSGDLALAGTVQTALNEIAKKSSTNPYAGIEGFISRPSVAVPVSASTAEYQFPDAAVGQSTYGLPGWTRQADVLRALAPVLSARDDTFTFRGYGDARDADGRIISRAACEAVFRRSREYVDPSEAADTTSLPKQAVNLRFGRRFEMISFRWLNQSEV